MANVANDLIKNALAILDKFEYASDGTVIRHPDQESYALAMDVITKALVVKAQ